MRSRKGRFLEATLGDPYSNLALEEVLFTGLRAPTLRVWANQRSVVIGRAQLARAETDLEYCRRESVPVVRRFTAGGAVYNGPGNLNWSFLVPRWRGRGEGSDPSRVFESFAAIVVDALEECHVESRYRPPNSIFDNCGKISGMAAYISKDAVLCHGTLLVDADLKEVEALTTPSAEELARRYPRSKVVSISNCGADPLEFAAKLANVFFDGSDDRHGTDANGNGASTLTAAESEAASSLAATKYASISWNLGDPFPLNDA